MDKELLILLAEAGLDAYDEDKYTDLGQAEYHLTIVDYKGAPLQILAMPGSNEKIDWLWNFHLWSVDGVKSCTHKAVKAVHKAVWRKIRPELPLAVVGHSKAGPDALRWMQEYEEDTDYCLAMCPPPAFRKWSKPTLPKAVIIRDKDDFVPWLGEVSFDQPIVGRVIELPRDKAFYDVKGRLKDHLIPPIINFLRTI